MTLKWEDLEFEIDMSRLKTENLLWCGYVQKIDRHKLASQRLFILTDWEGFIFKKKRFSKIHQLSRKFSLLEIWKIETFQQTSDHTLIIHWGKPCENTEAQEDEKSFIKMEGAYTDEINLLLDTHFSSCCLPEEQPIYIYDGNTHPPKAKPGSVIERMKILLRKKGIQFTNDAQTEIEKFLQKKPTQFKITQITQIIDFLEDFLTSLKFIPSITKIIVPCGSSEKSLLPHLFEFVKTTPYITHYEFTGKMPKDFCDLVDNYIQNTSCAVKSIRFEKCDFQEDQIQHIARMIEFHPVPELSIVNSLRANVVSNFFQHFQTTPGFDKVEILDITKCRSVDIRFLLPLLINVKTLIANDCAFEMSHFFSAIGKLDNTELCDVRLDGNRCSLRIDEDIKIPESISWISMNNISWEINSLCDLWQTLMKYRPRTNRLHLQLSGAVMPADKWSLFFDRLKFSKPSAALRSFSWAENKLPLDMLMFLKFCPALEKLDLTGCLEAGDRDGIKLLSQFIAINDTIKSLDVSGTPRRRLGAVGVATILKALETNKKLKKLMVRDNACGGGVMKVLTAALAKNTTLDLLAIDGNNIYDVEGLMALFDSVRMRGRKFEIPWPAREMRDVVQLGAATEEEVKLLQTFHAAMLAGDKKPIKRPPPPKIPQKVPSRKSDANDGTKASTPKSRRSSSAAPKSKRGTKTKKVKVEGVDALLG